jgi:hypothetical protein
MAAVVGGAELCLLHLTTQFATDPYVTNEAYTLLMIGDAVMRDV